jgi:predicted metal-binding membrane protein
VNLRHPQLLLIIAGLLLVFTATQALAQGCTQCLDSTRATPPAVQAAYRHAILLLVAAASTLFIIGLVLFRRNP